MVRISYHTVNRQIRSTAMQGGFKIQLLRDALGSVVQTTNFANAPGLTQRFAPYGTQTVSFPDSGQLGTDVRTGWVGSWGYRKTSLTNAERYVRARHYSSTAGRWTTRDKVWPWQAAYGLVRGRVLVAIDPTGRIVRMSESAAASLWTHLPNPCSSNYAKLTSGPIVECMSKLGYPNMGPFVDYMLSLLKGQSNGGGTDTDICVLGPLDVPPGILNEKCNCEPWGGKMISSFTDAKQIPQSAWPDPSDPNNNKLNKCNRVSKNIESTCNSALDQYYKELSPKGCGCRILLCKYNAANSESDGCSALAHEIAHCAGVGASPLHDVMQKDRIAGSNGKLDGDAINAFGCCTCCQSGGKHCRECPGPDDPNYVNPVTGKKGGFSVFNRGCP